MKNTLILLDRDGTLVYDSGNYHLGGKPNWKKLVKVLPGINKSLKLLKQKLPKSKIYIITNQPGISRTDLPLLTMKKSREVTKYIISKLPRNSINGFYICPHPNKDYVIKNPEFFNKNVNFKCKCIKPNPKMLKQAIKSSGFNQKNTEIYMIGDRATDVQAGINAKGTGILVPFKVTPDHQLAKYKKIKSKNKILKKTFANAVKFIIKNNQFSE